MGFNSGFKGLSQMYGDDSKRDLDPQQYLCESLKTRKSLFSLLSSEASVYALIQLLPF
jgi:hypothetical protein